ncbi:class A beta-lactamase [Roseibium sp. MMSF_3412]|uniref:class A beta-lactamase n=1 Tax=Roseibium sp. MMSF_3412 TaxID=3046712 RepID=UPI00273F14AC|nr:class A beta-lactamase [Roseibium sp. MMSF_3412]
MILSSRSFALLGALIPLLSVVPASAAEFDPAPVARAVEDIEARLSARVGVAVIDTQTGKTWLNKGDERFPLNSTFKAFLCAALLDAAAKGTADPEREVVVKESDIVSYSPVTEKRVGGQSFSIAELCEVTVTISDNAAANLVMAELGGPESVTEYMRQIGDDKTRIDRWEPDSNTGIPGDVRDTTTPRAAAETLRKLVLGDALDPEARTTLTAWLEGNKVGKATLRAGIPKSWRIADKTGAGANGSRNNIAVIWPEGRAPLVIAIYITQTTAAFQTRNKAIADIGAALAKSID